ncbi:hypothetical protein V8E55_010764 [Tylopilus felleus]
MGISERDYSPESTATRVPSTVPVAAPSTSVAGSLTPSPSISSSSRVSSGSKSNTGAIAGGVVGGLVGLVLVTSAVFFVMKKKCSQIPPFPNSPGAQTSSPSGVYGSTPFGRLETTQLKLYDPSDKSTFPPSPPVTRMTESSRDIPNNAIYLTSSLQPGAYNGMPEI